MTHVTWGRDTTASVVSLLGVRLNQRHYSTLAVVSLAKYRS